MGPPLILHWYGVTRRTRIIASPADLFKQASQDTILQLWLTPLTFKDLMGIEAGNAYFHKRRPWLRWTGLLASSLLAVYGATWISGQFRSFAAAPIARILFAAGVLAFWIPFYRLLWSDDVKIQYACSEFFREFMESQPASVRRVVQQAATGIPISIFMGILVVGAVICIGILFNDLFLKRQIGIYLLGPAFAALGGFTLWFHDKIMARWTERQFLPRLADAQWTYEQMVYHYAEKS